MKNGVEDFLSVIIIGRNEGDKLVRCINSVKEMSYPNNKYELIYVDSQSTDSSIQNAMTCGVEKVYSLFSENPCAAKGRNKGIREALGEFLLFLDGDTILDPDFMNKALPNFANEDIAVVFGHRREVDTSKLYNRLLDLDWDRQSGFSETGAGDMLVRKSVAVELGGYKEIIAGEDPEFSNRIINNGYKILHIDSDMVLHDLGIHSFKQYWIHAVRSGFAYAIVAELTKNRKISLWVKESRRNILQGIMYLVIFAMLIYLLVKKMYYYDLFILANMALYFLLSLLRNMRRIKKGSLNILYTLHSFFSKIPIFIGHLKFVLFRKSKLIEYK